MTTNNKKDNSLIKKDELLFSVCYCKPTKETKGTGMHYIPIIRGKVDSLYVDINDLVFNNEHGNGVISDIKFYNNRIYVYVIFNKEKLKKYSFKYPEDFISDKIRFRNFKKQALVKSIINYIIKFS